MLGTPPAFILSQDQTLNKWYLNSLKLLKSLSSCFSKLTQKNRDAHCASKALFGVKKLLIHCLIYKVHAPLGAGSLYYHAQKALSRVFFASKEENPGSPERFANIPPSPALVNTFFAVFWLFWVSLCPIPPRNNVNIIIGRNIPGHACGTDDAMLCLK